MVVEKLYLSLVPPGRKYSVLSSSQMWTRRMWTKRLCLATMNGIWNSHLELLGQRVDADGEKPSRTSSHRKLSPYLSRGYSIIFSLVPRLAIRAVTYLKVVVSPMTQNSSRLFAFRANIASRPRLTKQALKNRQKICLEKGLLHCLT